MYDHLPSMHVVHMPICCVFLKGPLNLLCNYNIDLASYPGSFQLFNVAPEKQGSLVKLKRHSGWNRVV